MNKYYRTLGYLKYSITKYNYFKMLLRYLYRYTQLHDIDWTHYPMMRQWRFKSIADDDKCLHSAVKSSQPNSGSSWRMCPLLTNLKQKTCRNSSWKNEKSESMPPPSSTYQCEEGAIFKELLDIMGQLSCNFAWHNVIGKGWVRKCFKSWVNRAF